MNGLISFSYEFSLQSGDNFPSKDAKIYHSHLVAPYWSNIDTRRAGRVRYETYSWGDSEAANQQISMVENFLSVEENVTLAGEWMMLVSWEDVHPYPHGTSAELERENPYLESVRLYQHTIDSVTNQFFGYS